MMRTWLNRSFYSATIISVLLASPVAAVEQAPTSEPLTEKQKLEQVKSYFESEYQEEDYFRTDRLLLTATGSLKPVHQAPSVATVITSEEIKRMGAGNLQDVLATVPGLYVSASFNAFEPIYSIRGVHTSVNPHIQMQVNGLPVVFAYNGTRPYFFNMPMEIISRIEVIRGPGSAVHGADAFSGVINIITKDGQEIDGTSVGLRYGSFNTFTTWLQNGGDYQGWDYVFNIEYAQSDGDEDRIIKQDMQSLLDLPPPAGFGTSASLAPASLDTEYDGVHGLMSLSKGDWQLRFWGFVQNDHHLGISITQTVDPLSTIDSRLFQADLLYENTSMFQDVDLTARLNYQYYKFDAFGRMFPPGAVLPLDTDGNLASSPAATAWLGLFTDGLFGEPIVTEQQVGIDLVSLISKLHQHQFRIATGAKYFEDKTDNYKNFGPGVLDTSSFLAIPALNPVSGNLTHLDGSSPYIFMNDQDRTLWYVSLQDVWSLARKWELTAGVRYDHYSDFGGTTNPRLALVWETMPYLSTKLLYGRAFRPPSFVELYAINNPAALGNPEVKPETIDTVEMAFDYVPISDFRLMLNLFTYKIQDLIVFENDPPPATTITAQNSRDQKGHGFEVESAWKITEEFELKANLAYQHSEDADTGKAIADAPRWQTYLDVYWAFYPEWSLDAQWFWIADRQRAAGDSRSDIDDYSRVNFSLQRKNIAKHLDIAVSVKNVFDEDIYEPSDWRVPNDFPMEGRSIFGELRFHF